MGETRVVNNERLRITITRETASVLVAFVGDLDVYAAADARSHLDEAIDRAVSHSINRVVIDAAGLRFCDSTGLATIMKARDAADARGVLVTLRNPTASIEELVHLTGLDALLEG